MRSLGVALALAAAGCAHQEPQAEMLRTGAPVLPVVTEHSAGLRCLGGLIDQSPQAPVSVVVEDIDDTTVPRFNEERRLSLGGSFVIHTALSRMQSAKVQAVTGESRAGPRRLTLGGAWTQDDLFTSSRNGGVRFQAGDVRAGLGRRTSYDFIAGDFTTAVNGRVQLSTAVGVALPRRGHDAFLVVNDGRDNAEIAIDGRRLQGAQMAQRRVLEAVVLVHMAAFFDIDYRPCVEVASASPEAFTAALARYQGLGAGARVRLVQDELARLGHLTVPPSGRWDGPSRSALLAYQRFRNLPPTGAPSAVLYALLATS